VLGGEKEERCVVGTTACVSHSPRWYVSELWWGDAGDVPEDGRSLGRVVQGGDRCSGHPSRTGFLLASQRH